MNKEALATKIAKRIIKSNDLVFLYTKGCIEKTKKSRKIKKEYLDFLTEIILEKLNET